MARFGSGEYSCDGASTEPMGENHLEVRYRPEFMARIYRRGYIDENVEDTIRQHVDWGESGAFCVPSEK